MVSALQYVRTLIPFPILGLDSDSGSEFLNQTLLDYCIAEQITFTRARPDVKNDQCHVEQKNRVVVRQVIGYQRLQGARAYEQLAQVYLALRLYVNGFQPSMKLQATSCDGRTPRRVYDAVKTPLQRLLLSQVLPASTEQTLQRAVRVLDPLRLLHHLCELQQALLAPYTRAASDLSADTAEAVLPFCLDRCVSGSGSLSQEQPEPAASPLFPFLCREDACSWAQSTREASEEASSATIKPGATDQSSPTSDGALPRDHTPNVGRRQRFSVARPSVQTKPSSVERTIEQVIQEYLQEQKCQHHRPKTLQWHQQSLWLLQHYLRTEHHCTHLDQITPDHLTGWLTWLPQAPNPIGGPISHPRSAATVQSHARPARAFCQWAVCHQQARTTPFAHLPLPSAAHHQLPQLDAEEWEKLLHACCSPQESRVEAEQATARNQAILWVLFETGMRASELCALRLCDVDWAERELLVRGKGTQQRRLTLGQEGWRHLLRYLDGYRLREAAKGGQGRPHQDHLFLSRTGQPLTKSGIVSLFGRLRKRAGITTRHVTASLLRDTVAARYLHAGGDLGTLQELLGQRASASWHHLWQGRERCVGPPTGREPPEP